MRRTSVLAALSFALAAPLSAQQGPGSWNFVFILRPKMGMATQFEAGMKKHLAWHVANKDKRSFTVSAVVAGDGVGTFRVVYNDLRLSDQDDAAPIWGPDLADVNLNIGPNIESVGSVVLLRNDSLSRIPATEPAKAMNWVTYNYLKPGKGPEYVAYLRALKAAHDKANSGYRYRILSMVIGAGTPAYVLVRPADKWVEWTPAMNRDVLVKAYGEQEADRLLNVLDDTVVRTVSFVTVRRPDLSYTP